MRVCECVTLTVDPHAGMITMFRGYIMPPAEEIQGRNNLTENFQKFQDLNTARDKKSTVVLNRTRSCWLTTVATKIQSFRIPTTSEPHRQKFPW